MTNSDTPTRPVTVYFDGGCPVCSREIAWYRRGKGADAIAWIDVATLPPEAEVASDLLVCDAMARFHVRTEDGVLHTGGRAFLALWKRLPGFLRYVAWFLSIPPGPVLIDKAYDLFLANRSRLIPRPPVSG